jgi:hypothetical protein
VAERFCLEQAGPYALPPFRFVDIKGPKLLAHEIVAPSSYKEQQQAHREAHDAATPTA